MATRRPGQPLDERGEDRPVCPVHVRSWVGAARHRDLVAQHEELDSVAEDVRTASRASPRTCQKIK